eukprot:SRR837773.6095.p2 GENE.SRR837773.6095~~SRR837773.6095.p2  ORF type:complete len:125 (+),score=62.31 SRR837773.6095:59-433(+)
MAARKGAKRNNVFTIDVSEPVDRTIIDAGAFADFLRNNIKVAGKAGNLGENVVVANDTTKVTVTSPLVTKDNAAVAQVSKRYLRYLTKKYVAKEGLREYLRVLTSGPDAYKITFFDLGEDEEEE